MTDVITFSCIDGVDYGVDSRSVALQESSIFDLCQDALREDSKLPVPFTHRVLEAALSSSTKKIASVSFEDALEVRKCFQFLGNLDSPYGMFLSNRLYAVSLVVARASGLNPCNFDEFVFFMKLFAQCDERIAPAPKIDLERMYMVFFTNNLNLEKVVLSWIGQREYDDLVAKARQIIHDLEM